MLGDRIETSLLHSSWQYYIPILFFCIFAWTLFEKNSPCFQIWVRQVIFPLFDVILPLDNRNPTKEEMKKLESQLKFRFPLYLRLILDWFFVLYAQHWFYENHESMSYLQIFFTIYAVGSSMSGNINIAHELMHKNNFLDKFLGMTTLIKNMYLHFYLEHIHGHHRRVATPEDPTTARRNETVFQFLPRTIIGSWISAWQYEEKRIGSREFSFHNRMHLFTICYIIVPTIVKFIYGWTGLAFFLSTAFLSAVFLEIVNYVEHYGLERKEISPGVYEKVDIKHSWNAPHRFTNYITYKLQRHSDHHENSYKPYQTLCSYENSPVLPHGYNVCIILSLNPKAWFDVMNERVDDYKAGIKRSQEDIQKINWKIYKVLARQSIAFTLIWIFEIIGVIGML